MHAYLIEVILNHSVAVTAVIALCRFKFVNRQYHPFLFLVWLGFLNETLSLILIVSGRSNAANSNVYVLAECVLILTQFLFWQAITAAAYGILLASVMLVWMADNIIFHSLSGNNSWFRIYYAFVIILCTLIQVNKIIIHERFGFLKNPVLIICFAFLIYYTCKAFIEVFNACHLGFDNSFNLKMFRLLDIVNFFSNIFFAIAILCIPRKQQFTVPC